MGLFNPSGGSAFALAFVPDTQAGNNALVGGDKTGNLRGEFSIDISSGRSGITKVASGDYSVAYGYNVEASGDYTCAYGANSLASGIGSCAFGGSNSIGAIANGDGCISVGGDNGVDGAPSVTAANSIVMGSGATLVAANSVAIGLNSGSSAAVSFNSVFIGNGANSPGGERCIAAGFSARAGTSFASAFGSNTNASSVGSSAFGFSSVCDGAYSLCLGALTDCIGTNTIAVGGDVSQGAEAEADFAITIGAGLRNTIIAGVMVRGYSIVPNSRTNGGAAQTDTKLMNGFVNAQGSEPIDATSTGATTVFTTPADTKLSPDYINIKALGGAFGAPVTVDIGTTGDLTRYASGLVLFGGIPAIGDLDKITISDHSDVDDIIINITTADGVGVVPEIRTVVIGHIMENE